MSNYILYLNVQMKIDTQKNTLYNEDTMASDIIVSILYTL